MILIMIALSLNALQDQVLLMLKHEQWKPTPGVWECETLNVGHSISPSMTCERIMATGSQEHVLDSIMSESKS